MGASVELNSAAAPGPSPAARRDTRLANEAWESLYRAQATLARELFDSDAWGGLAVHEYGVLYALSKVADAGLRISELGTDALLTQPGMSRLVARLEARGLVRRSEDPGDARAQRIQLTPRGASVQRRVGRRHAQEVAAAMTRTLDHDQLLVLHTLCSTLLTPGVEVNR